MKKNYIFTAHGQPNVRAFVETFIKLLGDRHGVKLEAIFKDEDESQEAAQQKRGAT